MNRNESVLHKEIFYGKTMEDAREQARKYRRENQLEILCILYEVHKGTCKAHTFFLQKKAKMYLSERR